MKYFETPIPVICMLFLLISAIIFYCALYYHFKDQRKADRSEVPDCHAQKFPRGYVILFGIDYIIVILNVLLYLIMLLIRIKNEYLDHAQFMFSYLSEALLSIIVVVIFICVITLIDSKFHKTHNTAIVLMIALLIEMGLLCMNYYLSLYITNRPWEWEGDFHRMSLVLNGCIYVVITVLLLFMAISRLYFMDILKHRFDGM